MPTWSDIGPTTCVTWEKTNSTILPRMTGIPFLITIDGMFFLAYRQRGVQSTWTPRAALSQPYVQSIVPPYSTYPKKNPRGYFRKIRHLSMVISNLSTFFGFHTIPQFTDVCLYFHIVTLCRSQSPGATTVAARRALFSLRVFFVLSPAVRRAISSPLLYYFKS